LLPELVTCGHDLADALANVEDALVAVIELYEDLDRPLPPGLRQAPDGRPLMLDYVVAVP
jgi:antitoxin HicB